MNHRGILHKNIYAHPQFGWRHSKAVFLIIAPSTMMITGPSAHGFESKEDDIFVHFYERKNLLLMDRDSTNRTFSDDHPETQGAAHYTELSKAGAKSIRKMTPVWLKQVICIAKSHIFV